MSRISCGGSCVGDWLWRLMCWGLAVEAHVLGIGCGGSCVGDWLWRLMCWGLAVEVHVLGIGCGGSCVGDWLWRLMCWGLAVEVSVVIIMNITYLFRYSLHNKIMYTKNECRISILQYHSTFPTQYNCNAVDVPVL